MRIKLTLLMLFSFSSLAHAENETLCDKEEDVYFSCKLESNDIVSICAKDNVAPQHGYVQYRIANENGIYKKIPEEFKKPEGIISSKYYHEKIYNFISFFVIDSNVLINAYSGSYGEDKYLEGITIGTKQITCKTPSESVYNFSGLEDANYDYSKFPLDEMIKSALEN